MIANTKLKLLVYKTIKESLLQNVHLNFFNYNRIKSAISYSLLAREINNA